MGYDDEARLRGRQDEADSAASRRGGGDDDAAIAVVGRTATKSTYPTAAGSFYWIIPQAVLGAEAEGGAGTLADDGGGFFALNLGGSVPASGTTVVCTGVPYRMVFTYG